MRAPLLLLLLPLPLLPIACDEVPGGPATDTTFAFQNHPPREPGLHVRGTVVCFARWDAHVTAVVESGGESHAIDLRCRDRDELWMDWAPVSSMDDRVVLTHAEFVDTRGPDRCDNPAEEWLVSELSRQSRCEIEGKLVAYAVFDLVTVD